jgi:glycosyltransferase involved in cell wall biosynthesis
LLAVDAVRRAQRRIPELRLLIAGAGPLRREVEIAAGPNIELLGWRDDPSVLLAACDALLNTSRWEGLPLSLLEALWRGRPIIACDAPGNAEAAGEGGVIVHGRDPQQLADAITSAFQTPGTLEELGRRGRARAVREFDEHRMATATLALYDVLAAASTTPERHRVQPTSTQRTVPAGPHGPTQPTDPRAARAREAVVKSVRP